MDTEAAMMAAVLHDVVEDTEWTLERLREAGFSDEVLEAVDCLTHREGESYEQFVERVLTNPIARQVKIADLEDNMNVRRIPDFGVASFALWLRQVEPGQTRHRKRSGRSSVHEALPCLALG